MQFNINCWNKTTKLAATVLALIPVVSTASTLLQTIFMTSILNPRNLRKNLLPLLQPLSRYPPLSSQDIFSFSYPRLKGLKFSNHAWAKLLDLPAREIGHWPIVNAPLIGPKAGNSGLVKPYFCFRQHVAPLLQSKLSDHKAKARSWFIQYCLNSWSRRLPKSWT